MSPRGQYFSVSLSVQLVTAWAGAFNLPLIHIKFSESSDLHLPYVVHKILTVFCLTSRFNLVICVFFFLGYHGGSIFHHHWLYDAENPFVYAWQAAFHMWKIGVQRFSASVHMRPTFLVFESFPIILNNVKLLVESLLMFVQVLLAFCTNLDPIMFPIPRLRILSAFHYVHCLRCQIHRS